MKAFEIQPPNKLDCESTLPVIASPDAIGTWQSLGCVWAYAPRNDKLSGDASVRIKADSEKTRAGLYSHYRRKLGDIKFSAIKSRFNL